MAHIRTIGEYLFVFLIFSSVSLWSWKIQTERVDQDVVKWDGFYYKQMSEQIVKGEPIHTDAPFVYRIGTPFLVAKIFNSWSDESYLKLNFIATPFITFIYYFWLTLYVGKFSTRAFLLCLFVMHWAGPIRWLYWVPAYVDHIGICFLWGVGLLNDLYSQSGKTRFLLVSIFFGCLGVLFREFVLIASASLIFSHNPLKQSSFSIDFKQFKFKMFLPFLCAFPILILIHFLPLEKTNTYSYLQEALNNIINKPIQYVFWGILIIFTPLISYLLVFPKDVKEFIYSHQMHLFSILGILTISWIGGGEVLRFQILQFPYIAILSGIIIEKRKLFNHLSIILISIYALIFSTRIFYPVPAKAHDPTEKLTISALLGNEYSRERLYHRSKRVLLHVFLLISIALITKKVVNPQTTKEGGTVEI